MKNWLNVLLTAAVSGAAGAVVQSGTDPGHVNWSHTGAIAGFGALVAIANLFREKPPSQQ